MKPKSGKVGIAIVIILLVAAVVVGWRGWDRRQRIRNVVLISLDTCRVDYLSCYGYDRNTTPVLDGLGRDGIVFENAIAPVPLTLPSHSTAFTGTYPPYHGVHVNGSKLLGHFNLTLAEILSARGFRTGAVVSTAVLDAEFGVHQGFDVYDDDFEGPGGAAEEFVDRRGDVVARLARKYLQEQRAEPFFLFAHFYDPHHPYTPPEPFASEYADDLYAGEVAFADKCVGEVIDMLKDLGQYESTLIVVMSDHGEALGEHGESEHGYYIYQGSMHVPLIMKVPGEPGGARVSEMVSLADIMPTILSYLDIPIPEHVQGMDLSAASGQSGLGWEDRSIYCESMTPTVFGCNPLLGLVTERWKYIETTRPELYDLSRDPREEVDVATDAREMAWHMRDLVGKRTKRLVQGAAAHEEVELDAESIRRLESLGYVGGEGVEESFVIDDRKDDAKDFIGFSEGRQQAVYMLHYEKFDEAAAIGARMLTEFPDLPNSHDLMGEIRFEQDEFAEAIVNCEKALEMVQVQGTRNDGPAATHLARTLIKARETIAAAHYKLGQFGKAVEHYEILLEALPNDTEKISYYALALFKDDRWDEAVREWTTGLNLKPNWPEAHWHLGEVYYKLGKHEQTLEEWRMALRQKPDWEEVHDKIVILERQLVWQGLIEDYGRRLAEDPNDADAQSELAEVYFHQGKPDRAIEHWRQAVRLQPKAYAIMNNLAWVLATVEDAELRDADEAVRLAEAACELSKYEEPSLLDTLGVAYAAAGRFGEAVVAAEKGIRLAEASQGKLVKDIQGRLELYRAGKAYVEK